MDQHESAISCDRDKPICLVNPHFKPLVNPDAWIEINDRREQKEQTLKKTKKEKS